MDINVLHPLIEVKIYCLQQKNALLEGGKGLVEPEIPLEPLADDYIIGEVCPASDDDVKLLLDVAPKRKEKEGDKKTLKDRLQNEQISIEEALAGSQATCEHSASPITSQPEEEDLHNSPNVPLKQRVKNFLQAWHDWRVQKYNIEYEYNRTKRAVLDKCEVYDDVIKHIDELIAEQKKLAANSPYNEAL